MSWFQSTNLASFAKTALKEAQKTIDKALDINEAEQQGGMVGSTSSDRVAAVTEAATDFFASWGVAVGSNKKKSAEDSLNSPQLNDKSSQNSSNSNYKSSTPRKQSVPNNSSTEFGTTDPKTNLQNQNQHKRSSSLEANQISPSVVSSSSVMCKSLTSDIPVTLVVPSELRTTPTNTDNNNANVHHHHTRSLSDTVFNSQNLLDDFEGVVQVLDESDSLSFDNHHHAIQTQPIKSKSKPKKSSSAKTKTEVKTKSELTSEKCQVDSSLLRSEISLVQDNEPLSFNCNSNVDLLSTVDLSFNSTSEPETSPVKDEIDFSSDINPILSTAITNVAPTEEIIESMDSLMIASEDSKKSNALCDNENYSNISNNNGNGWSWTDESSGFVDGFGSCSDQKESTSSQSQCEGSSDISKMPMSLVDVHPWASMQQITTEEENQNQKTLINLSLNEEQTSGNVIDFSSGCDGDSAGKDQNVTEIAEDSKILKPEQAAESTEESKAEDVKESEFSVCPENRNYAESPEHPELAVSNEEQDDKDSELNTKSEPTTDNSESDETLKASSPPASSISVIDSPRSPSPTTNPSESQRESPNNFEILSNSASVLKSSEEHQEHTHSHHPHDLPSSQPESSRSSSIVVVSARNSTPSSGSGASDSAGSDGHHDMEDNSHGSPSFERLDPPSQSEGDGELVITAGVGIEIGSSPQFISKGKHKKGASSASSSDIEVIPSDYQSQSQNTNETSDTASSYERCVSSTEQQTSPIPIQDSETQTDFIDEAKVLAEELPKKLTLEISEMLSEKDQMIEQLREEGEKLSKKQFDLSQIVKKLRAKEKEAETAIKELKGELAGKKLENERLMKSFVNKEGVEQNLNETVSKLNVEKRALELKVEQMRSELEDAKENCASMKASVEDASVEILELQNAISSSQRDSAELDSLTREKSELKSRNDSLQKEVEQLRISINSTQSKASSRESELQSQIQSLTHKLHTYEDKLSEISTEVADATMPLSLEIEKLQAELKNSHIQHERRESSLQSLLNDLEQKVKSASDRERSYKELNLSLQSNVSNLEERTHELEIENKNLKQEKSQRDERETKESEAKNKIISKLEAQVSRLTEEVERLSKENDLLGMELKSEKFTIEQERKKSQTLMEQVNNSSAIRNTFNQNQNQNQSHTRTNSMSNNQFNNSKSGENSPSSHSVLSEVSYLDEVFDPNGHLVGNNHRSLTPKSFFDSFSSVGLIENLQAQLRQRESEVMQFQEEVSKNEKIRKSLNEEIAKLTMQNQEFSIEIERLAELQTKLDELDKNYNALLQMYGEKVEETDELRMDLQDVKDMYKTQIEQLLKR